MIQAQYETHAFRHSWEMVWGERAKRGHDSSTGCDGGPGTIMLDSYPKRKESTAMEGVARTRRQYG